MREKYPWFPIVMPLIPLTMTDIFSSHWLKLLNANGRDCLSNATAAAEREAAIGKPVFPARKDWFTAFAHTTPEDVRVVILGQDPYPTAGNANGLAFSVPRGIAVPPSLRNIYKALKNDLGIVPAAHGDLRTRAAQGVLLLNCILTVEEGLPKSHSSIGWQPVADALIAALGSVDTDRKVFLRWGKVARKKAIMIEGQHLLVLMAHHPSPRSAWRGFDVCKHFSQANAFLAKNGMTTIDWNLPTI